MSWSITAGTPAESNGTSLAITAPAGSVGDLLVLAISRELGSAINSITGWTQVGTVTSGSAFCLLEQWYRVADGSGDDSPTVTSSFSQSQNGVILRISGQDAVSPFDTGDVTGSGDATSGNTRDTPALTLANAGELLVAVMSNETETVSYTKPSADWTEHVDYGSTAALTRRHRLCVASREVAGSGSYSPETFTLSANASRKLLVAGAFKAAAGGGGAVIGGGLTQSLRLKRLSLVG